MHLLKKFEVHSSWLRIIIWPICWGPYVGIYSICGIYFRRVRSKNNLSFLLLLLFLITQNHFLQENKYWILTSTMGISYNSFLYLASILVLVQTKTFVLCLITNGLFSQLRFCLETSELWFCLEIPFHWISVRNIMYYKMKSLNCELFGFGSKIEWCLADLKECFAIDFNRA